LWLANKLIPAEFCQKLQAIPEKLNPTFMVRPCMLCCGIMSAVTITTIVVFWISLIEYGAFYYFMMPDTTVSQQLNFGPAENPERLSTKLFMRENVVTMPSTEVQNLFAPELASIHLRPSEYYNMTVLFEVAETQHNMALGNLYIVAKIQQCN
jgi:hypothetical protein